MSGFPCKIGRLRESLDRCSPRLVAGSEASSTGNTVVCIYLCNMDMYYSALFTGKP